MKIKNINQSFENRKYPARPCPAPGKPRAPLRANPLLAASVFAPSATKMQETRNKMPAASTYLLENLHFLQFFVADSVTESIILSKGDKSLL